MPIHLMIKIKDIILIKHECNRTILALSDLDVNYVNYVADICITKYLQ